MSSSKNLEQPWIMAIQEIIGLTKDGKSTQIKLQERKSQLNSTFSRLVNSLDQAIILTDIDGFIVEISDKASALLRYTSEDLKGESLQKLYCSLHNKQFFKNTWAHIKSTEHTETELWYQNNDAQLIPVMQTSIRLASVANNIDYFIHAIDDISANIATQSKMQKLAMCDHLTNLPNRLNILQKLRDEVALLTTTQQKCAVIFIDLDGFRKVNDVYDHVTGDQLMLAGVKRLQSVITNTFLGRLGGDEFVIIYPFDDVQKLNTLLDNILASFIDPFAVQDHELFLGINIGVSIAPNNSSDPEELINQADMALHAIKAGEKRIQFYTADFLQCMQRQLKIEHCLKQAIETQELKVFFQPKYDLTNNKIVGMEALLRWTHHELGPIPPDEFIAIAENAGLIVNIGRYVLNACAQLISKLQAENKFCVPIAVNISGHHFSQANVFKDVQQALLLFNIAPEYIEIEITENVVMMDYDIVIDQLTQLKALGVQISIDDFGTGHSSLERLAKLPIDSLKIDRSFVLNLNEQPQTQAIIKAVLSLSAALGLKSVAEGIETISQEQFLRSNECTLGQGFLFAKPIAEDEMIALLNTQSDIKD
ncbi:putative bifunctional diguanylate cyclase/phosphodiesterase [Thalassotalea profundi]|nr:EAL domain-containing protein [Thalassotalea profundi]